MGSLGLGREREQPPYLPGLPADSGCWSRGCISSPNEAGSAWGGGEGHAALSSL
jgi:hypothetical protein